MSGWPALLRSPTVAAICSLCAGVTVAASPEKEHAGRSDAEITTAVEAAFTDVRDTDTHRIEVQTRNGVVQLTGFVDSKRARERAEQVAMDVPGVRHVRNEVLVRDDASADGTTPTPSRDAAIAARVKTQLAGESGLATASDVDVQVDDGVVQLSGSVSTPDQRREIESVARRVDGVTAVRNNVEVAGKR